MTYTRIAKEEIASKLKSGKSAKKAFLSSLAHTIGSIIISDGKLNLEFVSEYDFIINHARAIVTEFYGAVSALEQRGLIINDNAEYVLSDLGLIVDGKVSAGIVDELVKNSECAVEYIKGAFLGSGSVSILNSGYHLEFALSNEVLARDLSSLLAEFGLMPKAVTRKDKVVVYIKDSQSISDCLALLGAGKLVCQLNSEVAFRQVRKDTNRALNCDMANLTKTVNASLEQVDAIKFILEKSGLDSLSDKLRQVAIARADNVDYSYDELAECLGVSKSTVKYRLAKIVQIAQDLTEKQSEDE